MHQLPETRTSLIARLQRVSGESAWEDFCLVYEAAVLNYARRKGLSEPDARDVTQDVLAAVYQSIDRWQADGRPASFRRWLFRVTHNMVLSHFKQRARVARATGETWEWEQLTSAPAPTANERSEFDLDFRREVFRWAADRVSTRVDATTWRAFVRTALEGARAVDVASQLGMTVGGVYTAKCRVLARLKKEVEAFLHQHEE